MTTWEDRRGQFQKGKEPKEPPTEGRAFGSGVLESVRRASIESANTIEKTVSGSSGGSPASQRRRSSATGGLFANLEQHKRGSQDYGERRTSHGEHGPAPTMFSGWYNSTFRGHQKVKPEQGVPAVQKEPRKGVME
ncbi:hypothetical protein LTS10_003870 [Elasticomyces elasticus]|nr:hypothetical protein LTS10_003870 [Elasticomyces elasticus]